MAYGPNDRARRAAVPRLGGTDAGEFARGEFPREGYDWVVAPCRAESPRGGARVRAWGRVRRRLGSPGEAERNAEPTPEPAPA